MAETRRPHKRATPRTSSSGAASSRGTGRSGNRRAGSTSLTPSAPSRRASSRTRSTRPQVARSSQQVSRGTRESSASNRRPSLRQSPAASSAGTQRQRRVAPRREAQGAAGGNQTVRHVLMGLIAVLAVALVGLLVVLVLSMTPAFTITNVEAEASEHVSADNIVRLAALPDGATLLNLDETALRENLQKNPWVGEVSISREFPSTLRISITERSVDALVVMSAGNVAWCLGDGNVWIEPLSLSSGDGASTSEVAAQKASELGAVLIEDSPASVNPQAGSVATDDSILAVQELREELSSDFASQIRSFSASSASSISCVLNSGVEVSLGSATNVDTKEAIVNEILEQYPNRVVYINVRVPSKPSYRLVNTEYVQEGSDDPVDTSSDDDTTSSSSSSDSSTESESSSSSSSTTSNSSDEEASDSSSSQTST